MLGNFPHSPNSIREESRDESPSYLREVNLRVEWFLSCTNKEKNVLAFLNGTKRDE